MSLLSDEDWRRLLSLAEDARDLRCRLGSDAPDEGSARFEVRLQQERWLLVHPLARALYAPLIGRMATSPLTIAQVGQSLDGQIATASGHSHYINGGDGLDHLHRLRALVDAVVIGVSTLVLDDPQLRTRRVPGPDPVRVVIDPGRRAPSAARIFDGGVPSLLVHSATSDRPVPPGMAKSSIEPCAIAIQPEHGILPPGRILEALHQRNLKAVLIEGGGATVSTFLRAGAVQRLHVLVAPMVIGPGRPAFRWPAIDRLDAAMRFTMTAHDLGSDVLLNCMLEGRE